MLKITIITNFLSSYLRTLCILIEMEQKVNLVPRDKKCLDDELSRS